MKEEEVWTEYPTTDMFIFLFDELVEEAERIVRLAKALRTTDRCNEAYYDAMAELYVSLSHLEMHVPETRKEMDKLDELFPDEDE